MTPYWGPPSLARLRLSRAMRLVLLNFRDGRAPDWGLRSSQIGGLRLVVRALESRRLIARGELTAAGRAIADQVAARILERRGRGAGIDADPNRLF